MLWSIASNAASNDYNTLEHLFTNFEGMGSNLQVFDDDLLNRCAVSSSVTDSKLVRWHSVAGWSVCMGMWLL